MPAGPSLVEFVRVDGTTGPHGDLPNQRKRLPRSFLLVCPSRAGVLDAEIPDKL
jgi:hypothetical protein